MHQWEVWVLKLAMADISIRIPNTNERMKYVEDNFAAAQLLMGMKDTMYKPVGIDLKEYHPNNICLRLRQFDDGKSTLVELKTIKTETGYTDEKRKVDLEELAKYEVWGKMAVISFEYIIEVGEETVTILSQKIDPVGEFLKIESPSVEALNQILKELKVEDSEKIERNAAVLLGEKLGLI